MALLQSHKEAIVKGAKGILLGLAALFLLSAFAHAQTQPVYVHTILVEVKPSAVQDFEDYVKKIVAAGPKAGTTQVIYAAQLQTGGPQFTYLFTSPFSSFEEMGSWMSIPETLMKAHGEVEGAKILKAGRAAIESSETWVTRTQLDLSTNPRSLDLAATPFVRLLRTHVDPAMTEDYEKYLGKVKAAQEKAPGYPSVVRRVTALGEASLYYSATFVKNLSDLDRIPNQGELMRKAYGDEGAATITRMGNAAVKSREMWLLRYRPDLSRPTVSPVPTN
jgi:antibiotic biosynthesis monooxygenase (ABM) superfamily enzyme